MEQLLSRKVADLEAKKKAENELALLEFGQELRRIRRAKKLTQKRLNEITGIDDTVISDLENGNYTPSLVIIRQLADGLNVNPFELLAPYYGINISGLDAKGQQALDRIKEIISIYYHLEIGDDIPDTTRQRLKDAREEEADILADITPDVDPKPAPPENNIPPANKVQPPPDNESTENI